MKIVGKTWLTLLIGLIPAMVLAQGLQDAGSKLGGMQGQGVALASDVTSVSNTVVNIIFSVIGTVFFVLMIYGGFVWMKASGREDEISRAKKIVITALVGIAIVMGSYAITNFVLTRMASGSETTPASQSQ